MRSSGEQCPTIRGDKLSLKYGKINCTTSKIAYFVNDFTIYLDFLGIFSKIAPSKPVHQGLHSGMPFTANGCLIG